MDLPRKDAAGEVWHFRVWHDHVQGLYIQRVFFWNETKTQTGVIEMKSDQVRHISRLKQVIAKLVKNPEYRARYNHEIEFPVEHKYAAYEPMI